MAHDMNHLPFRVPVPEQVGQVVSKDITKLHNLAGEFLSRAPVFNDESDLYEVARRLDEMIQLLAPAALLIQATTDKIIDQLLTEKYPR